MQLEQLAYPLLQLADVLAEQSRADVVQDLLANQQAVEFFGAKPQARQLIGFVGVLVVMVAVGIAVVDQRRVKVGAQIVYAAVGGGFGAFQLRHDVGQRYGLAAVGKQPV